MSNEDRPDKVLASIPGWAGASWVELTGGLTNKTYRVTIGRKSGVLKIDDHKRGAPFNTRQMEADVQSLAVDAGLAGRVLYKSEVAYLTEYIDGVVWDPAYFRVQTHLEQLAIAMKKLHSLPRSGRTFDAAAAARCYLDRIQSPDSSMIELCTSIVEKTSGPQELRCCHNDLVAENIVATPDLKFLDWEYACDNDPLFDLATVIEHHELPEDHSGWLLNSYFGGAGTRRLGRLVEQRKLYLALTWLWLAARPDSLSADLQGIEQRLATSCS